MNEEEGVGGLSDVGVEPEAEPGVPGKRGLSSSAVAAEPTPPKDPRPLVLYKMKKAHKPEHWQFMRLYPQERHAAIAIDHLTSDHAAGAYCLQCCCNVSYSNGQTSTIGRHMTTHHQADIDRYVTEMAPIRAKKKLESKFYNADSTETAIRITPEQQKHANFLLAKWLATSQRPFLLVQDSSFLDYVNYITRTLTGLPLEVPSRNGIAGEIHTLAVQMRASLKEKLRTKCEYYCLSTDIWTDRTMRSYMAVTLHYLDPDFRMCNSTLEVEAFPAKHTGTAIARALDSVLARWGHEKFYCVRLVRDGASNAVLAGNHLGVMHASCVTHSLHLVVGGAMVKSKADRAITTADPEQLETPAIERVVVDSFELEEEEQYERAVAAVITDLQLGAATAVEEYIETQPQNNQAALSSMRGIVQIFRSLVVYLRKSSKTKNRFLEIRKEVQPSCKAWLQTDCPTRWSSTHLMLSRLVELKPTVEHFLGYLDTQLGKQEFGRVQQQQPTQEQWLAIECLVLILDPFGTVTLLLSATRYPTLVAVVPALRFVRGVLHNENLFDQLMGVSKRKFDVNAVFGLVQGVRRALYWLLLDRFAFQDTQLQWISYLDPRFSEMSHLATDEQANAQQRLINAAVSVAKTLEPIDDMPRQQPNVDPEIMSPPKNISKLMVSMYSGKAKAKSAALSREQLIEPQLRMRCESEFVLFLKDAEQVSITQDPLAWWNINAPKYPVLETMAVLRCDISAIGARVFKRRQCRHCKALLIGPRSCP